ncbi:MAG: hypothetical protein EA425_02460 [Puniceicoccaceae bacterium]|nr:MAG: hypothetical protein EA425_02460 [Puniceicoccaceae bacterium]
MKKTIALAVIGSLAGLSATTQAQDYSLSTDFTFVSQYVFRGQELADNTLQPSIEFSMDNFYAGIWAALPIENRSSGGWGDEIDFYAGFEVPIDETLSVDIGATYYYYPTDSNTFEIYAGITADLEGFTPSAYLFYDFDLKVWTLEGSIGHSIPLPELGASLDLSASVGIVEPNSGSGYLYWGVDVTTPYQINENAMLNFGVHYATHDRSRAFANKNHLWWSASVTIGF